MLAFLGPVQVSPSECVRSRPQCSRIMSQCGCGPGFEAGAILANWAASEIALSVAGVFGLEGKVHQGPVVEIRLGDNRLDLRLLIADNDERRLGVDPYSAFSFQPPSAACAAGLPSRLPRPVRRPQRTEDAVRFCQFGFVVPGFGLGIEHLLPVSLFANPATGRAFLLFPILHNPDQ